MIGVLLADDQALVRDGFRLILDVEPDLHVVGEAADGGAAVEQARALRPDVVLMDVRMPGVDGIEATRRIVAAGLPSRVLLLTTYDADEHLYDAMGAAASGFLFKDPRRADLVHAIRTWPPRMPCYARTSPAVCSTGSARARVPGRYPMTWPG